MCERGSVGERRECVRERVCVYSINTNSQTHLTLLALHFCSLFGKSQLDSLAVKQGIKSKLALLSTRIRKTIKTIHIY